MAQPHTHSPSARPSLAASIRKRRILGTEIAMTDYEQAMDAMDDLIARREPGIICAVAVHAVTVGYEDPEMREAMARASLVLPDGMPVVWAARLLGEKIEDRVYGPDLMLRYNERCAAQGHRVWLYGGRSEGALVQLADKLRLRHPGIAIVGYSPSEGLTADEQDRVLERINADRPDVLWVGTGAPRQEKWMARVRDRLEVPVMCGVGAAFDFHAGRVSQAPSWMQQRGLEWVYRIMQEPRRLLPRYLYYNPRFVVGVARQLLAERGRGSA
jgi:N-acetylglucosaminyldiphosphoundecaprenol N-acetyl-beta-D-mannosaminyltransferase